MSLPPNPQARYSLPTSTHQTRKPAFRCLPEIHASRLAVSGSLRPKLGLLLLLVVLLVSLCFILVPLLSKLNFSHPKTPHKPTLPLIDVFEDLSHKSSSNILLFSDLIVSSLAMVSSSTTTPLCGVLHRNSSSVTTAGRVFREKHFSKADDCPGVEEVEVDFKSHKGRETVRDWLKENGVPDKHAITEIENYSSRKSVIVSRSIIKLQLTLPTKPSQAGGKWIYPSGSLQPVKFTHLEGKFKTASLPTYTLVLLDIFKDNLELFFLLPHSKTDRIGHISWDDFDLSNYGTTHMQILLPRISLVSNLTLTTSLGELPSGTSVYQQNTLQLIPMALHSGATDNKTAREPDRGSITSTRLVFDHNFVLMVRELGVESPLVVGSVFFPG